MNTSGRYNPGTDSWIPTGTTNAPSGRCDHTAVWTDIEMIVWGGNNCGFLPCQGINSGGRYNPSTDTWIATSTTNTPVGRQFHRAIWTNSEMIVWGGTPDGSSYLNTGGRYNPGTDSWAATSTTDAPDARFGHTAIWSEFAGQMIVWGGFNGTSYLNTGGGYCAQSGAPTPTPTPTATASATATATPTATSTPTPTPTPCTGSCTPTPRPRPTPASRPSP